MDLNQRTVTFIRIAEIPVKTEKRPKKSVTKTWAKKTFRLSRPKRRMPPSKTKLAKAQARLKNVERERAAIQRFTGKFKPRHAHEKRLFKPEAKPSKT